MGALSEKLTSPTFRETYAEKKPYFELLDGEVVQKAFSTRLHSILQLALQLMLRELGFKARPELTLAINESWEPVPDVCGILGPEEDPYPTRAIAVAIEILSRPDRGREMGKRARQNAKRKYCANDIIPLYENYYRQVLSGAAAARA